jgi:histidinol-phosphate aminotransferase
MTDTLPDLARVEDLSMNETPFPPLPEVQALIERGAATVHRYPDNNARPVIDALADRLSIDGGRILVGPGSAGLCQHILMALGRRTEVVHPDPSFEAYPLLIMNAGARPVPVALHGGRHDLAAMAAATGSDTRAVLLCVPNNPTGAVLHEDELVDFLERIPPDVTVVLDEAYREFVTDPQVPDGVALHDRYPNLCVLRTFSKAYGLAALRIGYAIAAPATVAAARMVGQVYFPGALGQAAAVASLTDGAEAQLRARCTELAAARDALRGALLDAGLSVPPSEANFLWLPLGTASVPFAEHCRAAGILVRAYPDLGVRVTVGTPAANQRFLAAVTHFGPAPCGS